MSNDLAKLILTLRTSSSLNSKSSDTVIKKMTALAIDPLLFSVSLDTARSIARDGKRPMLDHLLQKMTLAQLKKLAKAWDPHRKFPKEVPMSEVRSHLAALLSGAAPTVAARKPRARKK